MPKDPFKQVTTHKIRLGEKRTPRMILLTQPGLADWALKTVSG